MIGVDGTLLTPLYALTSQQAKPTVETMTRAQQFLDYVATQEPAVLTYHKSDMILSIHSNSWYLKKPNARSRAGGHRYLSKNVTSPPTMVPFTMLLRLSKL